MARIKYLPVREARVAMTASHSTVGGRSATGIVDTATWTGYCTNVPSIFSSPASLKKQWAEAVFVASNYVHIGCSPQLGNSNSSPRAAFERVLALMRQDRTLDIDPAATLTMLTALLQAMDNPVTAGVQLLGASSNGLTAYQSASPALITAHLAATQELLELHANHGGAMSRADSIDTHLVALARINLVSTVLCASGRSEVNDMGNFIASNKATEPNSNRFVVSLGASGSITLVMAQTSPTGYCVSTVALLTPTQLGHPSPAVRGQRLRRSVDETERFQRHSPFSALAATAAPVLTAAEAFNIPMFSIAANPDDAPGPPAAVEETRITYVFPPSLTPTTPSTGTVDVFMWQNGSWVFVPEAIVVVDMSTRTVVITVAPPRNSDTLIISGTLRFTPVAAAEPAVMDVDVPVLVCGGVLLLLLFFGLFFARGNDIRRDAETPPEAQVDAIQLEKITFPIVYRYTAVLLRIPHHPITTPQRFLVIMVFLYTSMICAMFYARSRHPPERMAFGVVGGGIVAVISTAFTAAVRVPLQMQTNDWISFAAAVTASVAAIIGIAAGSFGFAALGAAIAGGAFVIVSAFFFRRRWSLRPFPAPNGFVRPATFCVIGTIVLANTVLAIIFGVSRLSAPAVRANNTFLAVFGFAILIDVLLLEPIKSLVATLALTQWMQSEGTNEEAEIEAERVRRKQVAVAPTLQHGRRWDAYDDVAPTDAAFAGVGPTYYDRPDTPGSAVSERTVNSDDFRTLGRRSSDPDDVDDEVVFGDTVRATRPSRDDDEVSEVSGFSDVTGFANDPDDAVEIPDATSEVGSEASVDSRDFAVPIDDARMFTPRSDSPNEVA